MLVITCLSLLLDFCLEECVKKMVMRFTLITLFCFVLVSVGAGIVGCQSDEKTGADASAGKKTDSTTATGDNVTDNAGGGSHFDTADNPESSDLATTGETGDEQESDDQENQKALGILHWNIESGGNHPPLIADQLAEFVTEGGYCILALSEVEQNELYESRFSTLGESGRWRTITGESGKNDGRENDRLMILFDSSRLKLINTQELNRHGDFMLNTGRHRSPLVAHFEDRVTNEQFLLVHNHLARGDAEFRTEQASGLREFGRDSSIAKVAVGDFNFDYTFETKQGNQGFVEMLRDNVWKWVEPAELVDTNWFDPEPDGVDNYPGSMLDFTFVSGEAKEWDVTSRVIVREGDFPDNDRTSDHRPVEVIIRF